MNAYEPIQRRLDDKTTVTIRPTDSDGVFLVDSSTNPDTRYVVQNAGRSDVSCSCPASVANCKHIVAVAEYVNEQRNDQTVEAITATEPGKTETTRSLSIVPAGSRGGVATRQEMTVRGDLARHQAMAIAETLASCLILARQASAAGLVPESIKTDEAAAMVIMRALELGIPYTSAFNFLYVVKGRIGIQAEMLLALINRSGVGNIAIVESTPTSATVRGTRKGFPPLDLTWTMAETVASGILSQPKTADMYRKYPADMLRYKAVARVARLMFADLTTGMDVADGEGTVVDSAYTEGEYNVTVGRAGAAPDPEKPFDPKSYPWWTAYVESMRDPGYSHRLAAEFLDAGNPSLEARKSSRNLCAAIDMFLGNTWGEPTTPAGLVQSIAQWIDSDRKTVNRVVIAPAPPPPAEEIENRRRRDRRRRRATGGNYTARYVVRPSANRGGIGRPSRHSLNPLS
jgi:hypothetical protein